MYQISYLTGMIPYVLPRYSVQERPCIKPFLKFWTKTETEYYIKGEIWNGETWEPGVGIGPFKTYDEATFYMGFTR